MPGRIGAAAMEIERYEEVPAGFHPSDSAAPAVASAVRAVLRGAMPGSAVAHSGSPSVPNLGGKGIIDLLLLYPPGALAGVRAALDVLGFQRQRTRCLS